MQLEVSENPFLVSNASFSEPMSQIEGACGSIPNKTFDEFRVLGSLSCDGGFGALLVEAGP